MITHYLKTYAPVSRPMLLVSLCLHGLLLGAAVSLYPLLTHSRKPMEIGVSRVKLVAPKIGPSVAEKLPETAVVTQPHTIDQSQVASRDPNQAPEAVRPKVVREAAQESIPLKKRQRQLARVEAPKIKKPAQIEEKQRKKKEDPQVLLERRLASLRDEVEKKKTDASQPRAADRRSEPTARSTASAGGDDGAADPESIHWLNTVRSQINSHWSLLADSRELRRVAIVGVRIADDGSLTDAAVDKSSGDEVFDRSALRAVRQAAAFPPVPARLRELIKREGGLALRFTTSGIQ